MGINLTPESLENVSCSKLAPEEGPAFKDNLAFTLLKANESNACLRIAANICPGSQNPYALLVPGCPGRCQSQQKQSRPSLHIAAVRTKTSIPKMTYPLIHPLIPFSSSLFFSEGTEEHADLSAALTHIRELISAVDLRVSQHEQSQWLSEVLSRMENKSSAKLKNGHTFRKQDMASGRALLHHGPLLWKTATGRLKDVLALLLTDLLVFLQEKDQKYIFAAVDQKPPVISLQKLIVREVANEERGMFLISASSAGPEMYEVHTASKDERNAWMRLIREAVVICHEKEDDTACESEEERRMAEAKVQKIHKLQESLCSQDQLICSGLEEKLQIYAELSAMAGHRDVGPEPRLLVRPGTDELPHAAVLLNAALKEGVPEWCPESDPVAVQSCRRRSGAREALNVPLFGECGRRQRVCPAARSTMAGKSRRSLGANSECQGRQLRHTPAGIASWRKGATVLTWTGTEAEQEREDRRDRLRGTTAESGGSAERPSNVEREREQMDTQRRLMDSLDTD
ncbi:hypothetical protein NFI96_023827, partial [Prochilodus magdalenae]